MWEIITQSIFAVKSRVRRTYKLSLKRPSILRSTRKFIIQWNFFLYLGIYWWVFRFCSKISHLHPSSEDRFHLLESRGVNSISCSCGVHWWNRSFDQNSSSCLKSGFPTQSADAGHQHNKGQKISFGSRYVPSKSPVYDLRKIRVALDIFNYPSNLKRNEGFRY